jgi:hypothetical protein
VKGNLDYVELDKLKGNQGDQNYEVPVAVDLQKVQRGGHLLRAIQRRIRCSTGRVTLKGRSSPRPYGARAVASFLRFIPPAVCCS